MLTKYLVKLPKTSLPGRLVRWIGRRLCLDILIRLNLGRGEILDFSTANEYPTITLADGTRLTGMTDTQVPIEHNGIPSGFTGIALDYITRFKYPHFMPEASVRTGWLPRRSFPLFLHPQHKNTIHELPPEDREPFKEALRLREGDRVLEVGSHTGFGTVRMSGIVGARGHVLSVEADPDIFGVLNTNVENNHLANVTTVHSAISDSDDENIPIYKSTGTSISVVRGVIENARRTTIQSKRISTLLTEHEFSPSFMVLTINGAELRALEACQDILRGTRHLRIIAPGWYDDGQGKVGPRIATLLSGLGFRVACTPGMHVFAFK